MPAKKIEEIKKFERWFYHSICYNKYEAVENNQVFLDSLSPDNIETKHYLNITKEDKLYYKTNKLYT